MSKKEKAVAYNQIAIMDENGDVIAELEVKDSKKIKKERIKEYLKYSLGKDDLLKYGEELANAQQGAIELEDELDNIKAEYKAKISAKEAEIIRLSNLVRQKYEMKNITCEKVFDFGDTRIITVRLDTGEVISTRAMTESEMQLELFEEGEKE